MIVSRPGHIKLAEDMPFLLNDRPVALEGDSLVYDLHQLSPIGSNGWVPPIYIYIYIYI